MSTAGELILKGVAWPLAVQLGPHTPATGGVTATGSTKATALALVNPMTVVTICPASGGVALPQASGAPLYALVNGGTNTCLVYSNSTDVINAGSAGTSFSVAAGKTALFWPAANTWAAVVSA